MFLDLSKQISVSMKYNKISIAKRLISTGRFKKAKSILIPLTKKKCPEVQYLLGRFYLYGDEKATRADAIKWFSLSSKNKNADATYYLALLSGNIFEYNLLSSDSTTFKCFQLMNKAANQGSALAQRSLAISYANGERVKKDNSKVLYWDEKAAKQGLAESQNDLALFLLNGIACEVDVPKAIYWYSECATNDDNGYDAEIASLALVRIYSGEYGNEYLDIERAGLWKSRVEYLKKSKESECFNWPYG